MCTLERLIAEPLATRLCFGAGVACRRDLQASDSGGSLTFGLDDRWFEGDPLLLGLAEL